MLPSSRMLTRAAAFAAAFFFAQSVQAQNVIVPMQVIVATGTTGAVTATLPATGNTNKTTFICGFDVSAAGGTATISPITVTGLLGGTFTYQGISSGGAPFSKTFTPCLPASVSNTAISVVTTADGSASAVDVQVWGFWQ